LERQKRVKKKWQMRFDLHMRRAMRDRLVDVSSKMAAWDHQPPASPDLHRHLINAIQPFDHTTSLPDLLIGGVDGSGYFPAAAYGDSFVYVSVASATLYESDAVHGLKEIDRGFEPLVEFTWLTTSEQQRTSAMFDSFERLMGRSVDDVLSGSDYSTLSRKGRGDLAMRRRGLIIPPAHDAGNVGVQLRTTAELAAALQLIEASPSDALVLTDGTMSLPFVQRDRQSLFFEHLRRFCCVRAQARNVVFAALSKSHGLPSGMRIEEAAREKLGVAEPEHWFMRVPEAARDGWSPWSPDGPTMPPLGAVSFLIRLHRSTPIMRIDFDARFWEQRVSGSNDLEMARRFFGALDYASHDQRCYGYPYPVKAAHDRGSLTELERGVLRQQLVDAAVQAGMRRSSFRDTSQMTGHR
jgi:hypothetical protein